LSVVSYQCKWSVEMIAEFVLCLGLSEYFAAFLEM
jgi:hypothetical protein